MGVGVGVLATSGTLGAGFTRRQPEPELAVFEGFRDMPAAAASGPASGPANTVLVVVVVVVVIVKFATWMKGAKPAGRDRYDIFFFLFFALALALDLARLLSFWLAGSFRLFLPSSSSVFGIRCPFSFLPGWMKSRR